MPNFNLFSVASILIVDDDVFNLKFLEHLLQAQGYNVSMATDPLEAISQVKNQHFDLMILDIEMPTMNGFELSERLKEITSTISNTPVIFISALGDIETKLRGFETGAVDYISKPFYKEEVLARIKRHLQTQQNQSLLEYQNEDLLKQLEKKKTHEQINNRYDVLELIGKGGMARVYKARHKSLNKWMALKILEIPDDNIEEYIARFIVEAQSIAKINHRNVVSIYDAGIIEKTPYLAMEYIDGPNLEKVRNNRELPYSFIHDIVTQAARGLLAAHTCNIIHRDIKPSNLLIDRNKVVKLTDFGIAKDLTTARLTTTGSFVGTLGYMAPECCSGGNTDIRSDIYSLGVTTFFLLTGKIPFAVDNTMLAIMQSMNVPMPDPRVYKNDIPEDICKIVLKMTQKLPDMRYQNVYKFLEDMDKICPIHSSLL